MSSRPSRFFVLHMVLGHEADLVLARSDAVVELRLHGVEGLLQLLFGDGPDGLFEGTVGQIDEAVAEDRLAVIATANISLNCHIGKGPLCC